MYHTYVGRHCHVHIRMCKSAKWRLTAQVGIRVSRHNFSSPESADLAGVYCMYGKILVNKIFLQGKKIPWDETNMVNQQSAWLRKVLSNKLHHAQIPCWNSYECRLMVDVTAAGFLECRTSSDVRVTWKLAPELQNILSLSTKLVRTSLIKLLTSAIAWVWFNFVESLARRGSLMTPL